jgi:hypothetical protein
MRRKFKMNKSLLLASLIAAAHLSFGGKKELPEATLKSGTTSSAVRAPAVPASAPSIDRS